MAVAGEAKIEPERRQILVPAEEIERTGKAQPQLVAIERRRLHFLEDLGEIDRGDANPVAISLSVQRRARSQESTSFARSTSF